MNVDYALTIVAFVRSTGGQVRVLLTIDADGEQLFDGDPALLGERRPGAAPEHCRIEGADAIPAEAIAAVAEHAASSISAIIDSAFSDVGEFEGNRMLGQQIQFHLKDRIFGL